MYSLYGAFGTYPTGSRSESSLSNFIASSFLQIVEFFARYKLSNMRYWIMSLIYFDKKIWIIEKQDDSFD